MPCPGHALCQSPNPRSVHGSPPPPAFAQSAFCPPVALGCHPAIPFSSPLPGPAQMQPQCPAAPLIRPNPTVDCLVAHHRLPLMLAPPNNLLRAEPLPDHGLNGRKLRRPIPQVPAGSPLSPARLLHRVRRPIVTIMCGPIPLHLPIQRATMPPKMLRHFRHPQTLPPHRRNLIPFLGA